MKRDRYILVALGISLLLNVFLFLREENTSTSPQDNNLQSQVEKYPYISKRILAEIPNDYLINFVDLRSALRSEVEPYQDQFAFYFEYLPTGVSIGVNEKDEFNAASLLKVPIVMGNLLQEEEEGAENMPETITLTQPMIDSRFGDVWKRGAGAQITREEAIKYALEDSDNTALQALISITDYKYYERVNDGLDVEIKDIQETPVLTMKNYSSILQSLFFSSVVSLEHSQEILDHLAKSKFKDKLAAGVPDNIVVANKIGTIDHELYTDCGIVYVPRRPYLLCMLSASEDPVAKERMQKVSKIVYDFVSDANKTAPSTSLE